MADISKCSDTECPSKNTCLRFRAKSSPMQSYVYPYRPKKAEKCNRYVSTDAYDARGLNPVEE